MQRRERFLQEIGIGPLWLKRDRSQEALGSQPGVTRVDAAQEVPANMEKVRAPSAVPTAQVLADLPLVPETAAHGLPDEAIADMDWPRLKSAVSGCTRCGLCRGRTQTVFGVGDEQAKWLFVGEGPGRNEDMQGEPFVGPAGRLLDNMLLALGLRRGDNAYIANIVKCRPTDDNGRDRPPSPAEIAACMPYLERQIALIQPSVIVALGKTAAVALLGMDPDTPVSTLRGTLHRHAGRPLIVTYHPAYLLRSPADKRKSWADLCLAMTAHVGS